MACSVNLEELTHEPGGKAAVAVFRKTWLATAHAMIDRADQPEKQKDAMVAVSQTALRLTKADAKKLAASSTTSSRPGA